MKQARDDRFINIQQFRPLFTKSPLTFCVVIFRIIDRLRKIKEIHKSDPHESLVFNKIILIQHRDYAEFSINLI